MKINYERWGVKSIMLFILFFVIVAACDKFERIEKYQAPDWLVGKIYTQIADTSALSMFAQCIVDVGYDSIIDKSGTYTAFAPNNQAFEAYLLEKSYTSVDDIPYDEKLRLVKYHLIQMPWNLEQLQGLSRDGWINEMDVNNNKPFAFKRQTLLRNENRVYPVKLEYDGAFYYQTVVPESESNGEIVVYANSRKYAPLFFDDFLSAANLSGADYSFYFDRDYQPGNFYFAGGMMVGDEIFADNGIIYMIDKVIDPLPNAEELMDLGYGEHSYTDFKNLLYLNSEFSYNSNATLDQEGAEEGKEVDELYDLSYPDLAFDIHQELTYNPNSSDAYRYTIEYHHGIVVPTNEAFNQFVKTELTGPGRWDDLDQIPASIKRLLVNGHMTDQPIYEEEVKKGFFNENGDYITIDESTIIQKSYGSNATFIGVNEVIPPKAFSSVSAPMYLNPEYQTFLAAFEMARLLPALKQEAFNYTLFIINDQSLMQDQSLTVVWRDWKKDRYSMRGFDLGEEPQKWVTRPRDEISNYMLGLIAIEQIDGSANKEYLETLDGRHLVLDNTSQILTGGEISYYGYNGGDSAIDVHIEQIAGDFYNGEVYEIDGWMTYSANELFSAFSDTKFLELLKKAGLSEKYELTITNDADRYTVFLPSDEALDAVKADSMDLEDLRVLLRSHFIKNELIFTDGKKAKGLYKTMAKEDMGSWSKILKLNISPGFDEITILDSKGDLYYKIEEAYGVSNIVTTRASRSGIDKTGAIVHKIDTVLLGY